MRPEPNELRPELLSTLAINPFKQTNSASRDQMLSNHIGQHLTIERGEERLCQSGNEAKFGMYTFSVKMPHNGYVIKRIDRYERTYDADAIAFSPHSVLIYEREDSHEIDVIDLPRHSQQHPYFGFAYKPGPAMAKMNKGNEIAQGETFLNSPAINAHEGYEMALNLNVAFMSVPGVAEDGIVISESTADKYAFRIHETRTVECGSKAFPVNAYGYKDPVTGKMVYKPHPDIGDPIRPDGLLMALRTYDETLAPIEQGLEDLLEVDRFFDQTTYVGAGGRVVDIRVFHSGNNPQQQMPEGMEVQMLKYDRARRLYYQEILDEWLRLKRERGSKLLTTPKFNALVREAISVVGHNSLAPNENIKQLYRQAPLDEWRIEFTVEYLVKPKKGAKLTDFHGGKGVICEILPDDEMPVDAHGNRADAIMDGGATVSRMNYGRLYEHFFNAASRDLVRELTIGLGFQKGEKDLFKKVSRLEEENPALFEHAWNRLMGLYEIISPRQYAIFIDGRYEGGRHGYRSQHLAKVIKHYLDKNQGAHLWVPTDNQPELTDIVRNLQAFCPPLNGSVSYVGNSGRRVNTVNPVIIAPLYVMLLEKIADDWSACPSGKLQHFGVLSQLSAGDKYSKPTRTQPIRAMGESEVRIYTAYCGTEVTADLLDRNNNPFTHKYMLNQLFSTDKPTAIKTIVDRTKVPMGGSKPLQLIKHIASAGGWKFVYEPPRPIK
jgi:DNA-directed RNA polymerase beta subunit